MIVWLALAAAALMAAAVPPWIVGQCVEAIARAVIRRRKKNN